MVRYTPPPWRRRITLHQYMHQPLMHGFPQRPNLSELPPVLGPSHTLQDLGFRVSCLGFRVKSRELIVRGLGVHGFKARRKCGVALRCGVRMYKRVLVAVVVELFCDDGGPLALRIRQLHLALAERP